jgi:hypothetical protein
VNFKYLLPACFIGVLPGFISGPKKQAMPVPVKPLLKKSGQQSFTL